jgi:hypothetical protein
LKNVLLVTGTSSLIAFGGNAITNLFLGKGFLDNADKALEIGALAGCACSSAFHLSDKLNTDLSINMKSKQLSVDIGNPTEKHRLSA